MNYPTEEDYLAKLRKREIIDDKDELIKFMLIFTDDVSIETATFKEYTKSYLIKCKLDEHIFTIVNRLLMNLQVSGFIPRSVRRVNDLAFNVEIIFQKDKY